MAATLEDIVNMFDTVKHSPSAKRALEDRTQRFEGEPVNNKVRRPVEKNKKLTEKTLRKMRKKK